MIYNTEYLKEENNTLIAGAIKEILTPGISVTKEQVEFELGSMLEAMRSKNKIYDFAIEITHNILLNEYNGKIAYSLINTEKMTEAGKRTYESLVEFKF